MQTYSQINISHVAAMGIAEKAVKFATNMHIAISVCVVDLDGRIKAKLTMDGAPLIADELVEKKARTALLGMSTASFKQWIRENPELMQSFLALENITVVNGGYPLWFKGRVIGAFAIGGGTAEQDEICADAVIKYISELNVAD